MPIGIDMLSRFRRLRFMPEAIWLSGVLATGAFLAVRPDSWHLAVLPVFVGLPAVWYISIRSKYRGSAFGYCVSLSISTASLGLLLTVLIHGTSEDIVGGFLLAAVVALFAAGTHYRPKSTPLK
jgi:uncharacterized membrane protein YccC